MGSSFQTFAVLIAARGRTGLQRGKGWKVEDAQEPSVVASGPVVVAGDAAGVPGRGVKSGDAGKPVWGFKDGQITACGAEEPGGEDGDEAGHAEQDLGVPVCGDLLADQRAPEDVHGKAAKRL